MKQTRCLLDIQISFGGLVVRSYVQILVSFCRFRIPDWLISSHHGQGIMSAVVKALVYEWGVPRMGIRRIVEIVFSGNVGSQRVLEKSGFQLVNSVDDCVEARGHKYGVHVMELELVDAAEGRVRRVAEKWPEVCVAAFAIYLDRLQVFFELEGISLRDCQPFWWKMNDVATAAS